LLKNDVIGPLCLEGKLESVIEVLAEVVGDPNGEELDAGKIVLEGESEAAVEVIFGLAFPRAAEATSAVGLGFGDDDDGGRITAGEELFSDVVGAGRGGEEAEESLDWIRHKIVI
jgi:hypothetical protein